VSSDEPLKKAQFLFKLFSSTYAQVGEASTVLDQKINNTLSLSATLATFFIGVLYYVLSSQNVTHVYMRESVAAFMLGTFMFFIVVVLGVVAYKPWALNTLSAEKLRAKHIEESLLDLVKIAAVNVAGMEHENRLVVATKARYYEAMLVFLMFGVLCFVGGFTALAWPYLLPLS
jgi:hypothetical protein